MAKIDQKLNLSKYFDWLAFSTCRRLNWTKSRETVRTKYGRVERVSSSRSRSSKCIIGTLLTNGDKSQQSTQYASTIEVKLIHRPLFYFMRPSIYYSILMQNADPKLITGQAKKWRMLIHPICVEVVSSEKGWDY